MLVPSENDVPQHDGIVVNLVPGRIDEGDRTLAGAAAEILQYLRMPGEFRAVAAAELVPAVRVMAEPGAELGARRDLLDPFVEPGFGLADAAWPQAVDEDSRAVAFFGRFIGPFERDVRSGNRAGDDSGGLRKLAGSRGAVLGLADRALELDFGEQSFMIAVHHRDGLLAAFA